MENRRNLNIFININKSSHRAVSPAYFKRYQASLQLIYTSLQKCHVTFNYYHYLIQQMQRFSQLVHKYQTFLFDLDGVHWNDKEGIQGSKYIIDKLRESKKNIFFITNNSMQSQEQTQAKFASFDIMTHLSEIVTTSYLISSYIKAQYPGLTKVACLGSTDVRESLKKAGLDVQDLSEISSEEHVNDVIEKYFDKTRQAVVMGYDPKINHNKLCLIAAYLQHKVQFIGTNPDKFRKAHNFMRVSAGFYIEQLERTFKIKCQIIGKPNPYAFNYISSKLKTPINKKQCLMIGDNLDTDIEFAKNIGIDSVCVLTGKTNIEQINVRRAQGKTVPNYVCERLDE